MKACLLHREAELELDAAMAYYEQERRGLGVALHAEVERAVELIRQFPNAYPLHLPSGNRKFTLARFPYSIFYLDLPASLWITAVAHAKREPHYWRARQP